MRSNEPKPLLLKVTVLKVCFPPPPPQSLLPLPGEEDEVVNCPSVPLCDRCSDAINVFRVETWPQRIEVVQVIL